MRSYSTSTTPIPPGGEKESTQKPSSPKSLSATDQSRSQRIWRKIKEEASHYWHGTKLLGKEIRISAKYQMKLLKGKKLTRRERRQLKRTTSDLLRLIPFSVFLIVPFMELLLPIALRLFPNMLPSTFRDESKELEKKRKLLKVRLEMAKFLQETLRESGMSKKLQQTEEFKEFFRKVRNTGEKPSMVDVVKVAKFFEDDLTLDNLSRPQLVSMCKYMNINAFGTDNFLRYTLRKRMEHLEADDAMIDAEGIDSLSVSELRHACQSRGIRSMNVDEGELRKELGQWIDLHLKHGLSATLLILGRAFAFNRGGDSEVGDSALESLKDALSSLPDTLLNEAELEVSQENITNKQRLTVLEEQEELIADESEQEQKEEEARKAQRELEKIQKAVLEDREKIEKVAETAATILPSENEVDPESVRMTSEQLNELGEALSILSTKSSVLKEKMELKQLAELNREAAQDPENTSSAGLVKSIQKIIQQIDQQLGEYDKQVGDRMHQINIGQDGKISVGDLKKALGAIKHSPSDEAIEVLIDKLDVDHDGFVPLDHVLSLAEEEGLGIVLDEESASNAIISQGQKLRKDGKLGINDSAQVIITSSSKDPATDSSKETPKPKKSDIVEDP
ncbi:LETM1-like protein-domain-containing protein [Phakopsora pachyrhizi]|uniref:Mitochondrial proton/calcium exchanger protein n=1 Tax=Phakopsora pachyrhizi TaxID=170000 RepID=A0AAV0BJ20_PHAPC|nr:LETM1-like protein-domain-containing protein [Phakopsora pachyrhizi]CAH7685530.1 LETM1-like protein-domain-containing protein [Phakopsora pachyrhizi]